MTTSTSVQGISLPPLAGLFLTHFDDIKGQSVIFWRGIDGITQKGIEHASLPSGLHNIAQDLILFSHGSLPSAGIFQSKTISGKGSGRGRRMGSLGVILAKPSSPEDLFYIYQPLESLFNVLESLPNSSSPFVPSPSAASEILEEIWRRFKVDDSVGDGFKGKGRGDEDERVRRLIRGRGGCVLPSHPVTYLPVLLSVLGPSIVGIYKAALSGKRVLVYSPPPLLPLAAFAWCIWAISLPPSNVKHNAERTTWLGNVGLMDLDRVKKETGGWVGTTSDAIYKSHIKAYDVFIDLSSCDLRSLSENGSKPTKIVAPSEDDHDEDVSGLSKLDVKRAAKFTPIITSTMVDLQPAQTSRSTSSNATKMNYSFGDLPLYKSLLLLAQTPLESLTNVNIPLERISSRAGTGKIRPMNTTGTWWLIAMSLVETVWKVCVGVCGFAIGRGGIALPSGERDGIGGDEEPLLAEDEDADEDEDEETMEADGEEEEDVIRGRLILSQFHHNTYHLYAKLLSVLERRKNSGEGGVNRRLKTREIGELVGTSWIRGVGVGSEGRFWDDVSVFWGLVDGLNEEDEIL